MLLLGQFGPIFRGKLAVSFREGTSLWITNHLNPQDISWESKGTPPMPPPPRNKALLSGTINHWFPADGRIFWNPIRQGHWWWSQLLVGWDLGTCVGGFPTVGTWRIGPHDVTNGYGGFSFAHGDRGIGTLFGSGWIGPLPNGIFMACK